MYYIVSSDQKLKRMRDCVAGYIAAGLAVCRLTQDDKNPQYFGWPTHSLPPHRFGVATNVGIITGWISDGGRPGHALVVIDLDAIAAIPFADVYLPPTGMVEGRPGKPRSHRYYLVPVETIPPEYISTAEQSAPAALAAGKHPGPAKQRFRDCEGTLLVEVLGSGQQAAAPPSVHPSGEVREWQGGTMGTPAVVPWPDLLAAVRRVADAMKTPSTGKPRRPKRVLVRGHHQWRELFPHLAELGIEVSVERELSAIMAVYQQHLVREREARAAGATKPSDAQQAVEQLFPATTLWVNSYGHIEVGDQEGFGFIVRALDYGGLVFEDDRPATFAAALASLEAGLREWFRRERIEVPDGTTDEG